MHWTNLLRDLKANVVESHILEAMCARCRSQFTSLVYYVCHAPVPWNVAQSLTCKSLPPYEFLKSLFSLDKSFLVLDALFAEKLTKLCLLPYNTMLMAVSFWEFNPVA